MDLDEWEYLPDDGFLDFHEEKEEKRIFSSSKRYSDSKGVFNMNYCIIPSTNSRSKVIHEAPPPISPPGVINSRLPNTQLVPVPIQLELPPTFVKVSEEEQEEVATARVPVDEKTSYKLAPKTVGGASELAGDQDTQLSQVYFKKTWENEFADMIKMDSPKSPTCRSSGFMQHQSSEAMESKITSPRMKINNEKNNMFDCSEDAKEVEDDDQVNTGSHNNNNIWKLSLTGIGAICSFGFAAATICILFFGAQQKNIQYQQNQNRFQIYTDDNKSIKQAVQHATKLNDAFSAGRGVPLTRAHVTYGGYYNGL